MAFTRRESESLWPERSGERLFDWPFHPVESWRRMFGEDDMKVEEFVEDNQLVVRAELPGVDPDRDVDVSIVDGNLRIRAERRHEEKEETRNYRRQEFRYGSFSRVVPLPAKASESDITATYKDGVLEVRAPIEESSPLKSKIPINRS
jgi:HSP20 family protein